MNSKICTDLEQSKKLLELGIDVNTADMIYQPTMDIDSMSNVGFDKIPLCFPFNEVKECNIQYLPAWSLAALLNVLPDELGDNTFLTLQKEKNEYCCCYEDINGNSFRHTFADNPVDACVAMIERLHELKML